MIIFDYDIYLIAMAFIRAGIVVMSIPFWGGDRVPMLLRLAIALGVTLAIYPMLPAPELVPTHVLGIILVAAKEIAIGMLIGLGAKVAFFIVEFAGHVISTEIGLSMSSSFDPVSGSQSTTLGSLLFYFVALLFLATNTHFEIIRAFASSFSYVPVSMSLGISGTENFIKTSGHIFVVGMQLAAPMIALNFIINMSFAVLGKAAPKINVFMISFAVRIIAGLSLVLLTINLLLQYLMKEILDTPDRMLNFLIY